MKVNRISQTIQEFDGVRYYLCGNYFQRKGSRLHIQVWKHYNDEPIPKGFHIHHKDGDRSNNDIANLELVPGALHLSLHQSTPERKAYGRQHAETIRALAAKWHGSPQGREWHSKTAKKMWAEAVEKEYICTMCGKRFSSIQNYGSEVNRFCCNGCKTKYRNVSGVDNVERMCTYCGNTFTANKYSKTKCCSRKCASNRRWGK